LANGGEQLFLRRSFHHVTLRAGTERALSEDGLLKSGVNENQQTGTLRFEGFKKFKAVAGAQAQCSQQQLRFALVDSVARITNVVDLAADDHIVLRIQKVRDAVAKERVLFQNQDPDFTGMLFWGGHVGAYALRDCGVFFAILGAQMSSREFPGVNS